MSKRILRAGKIGVQALLVIFVFTILLYSAKHLLFADTSTKYIQTFDTLSEAITVSGYTVDPNIPSTDNLAVADFCLEKGKDAQARKLYEQTLYNKPNDSACLSAYKGLVKLDSKKFDDPNYIPYVIADMKSEFAGSENLPNAVYDVARYCHNQAFKINKKIDEPLANSLLTQAIPLFEESVTNIDEAQKPDAYLKLAESYSRLGNYQQALEYYEELIDKYPDYEKAWHVYFMIGRCYEKLANLGTITFEQADEQIYPLYAYIVQEYPDCKAAKAANNWLALNAQ